MSQRRPSRATAQRLAERLDAELSGCYIDKLWRTGPDELLIRFAGRKRRLLVRTDVQLTTMAWTATWPETPQSPDYETIQLRTHLEGGRVKDAALVDNRRLVISLTRGDGPRELSIQLAGRFPNVAAFAGDTQLGVALRQDRPGADEGAPPLPEGPVEPDGDHGDSWLTLHGDQALRDLEQAALERHRHVQARLVRAWQKKLKRTLKAVERDLTRAQGAEQDRVFGELLKSALGRIRKGAKTTQVVDYSQPDAPEVDIPLDPALDAVENMQQYFRRYRKYRGALNVILKRHTALGEQQREAEAIGARIAEATTHEALSGLETALRDAGWRPARPQRRGGKAAEPAPPYRRFLAADGTDILVGRGARFNDELTFRVARGRDLWFHARDSPGAHVILRAPRGSTPSQESILDAATLAGWYSKARGDGVIDITWTERKHVRKPKGAPSGRVTVADGRNVAVRMDQSRIDRLYASAPED